MGKPTTSAPPKKENPYALFFKKAKKEFPVKRRVQKTDPAQLNVKQKKAYDVLERHLANKAQVNQLLMIVSGSAGSGKSWLALNMSNLLTKHKKKFKIMSFTGCSAFLIGGSTFHSTLRMPYFYRNASPDDGIKQAQTALKNVEYLIMDEMSLIGCYLLGYVSERLKLIFNNDLVMGGMSCIMMGDNSQLKPVGDIPLFKPIHTELERPLEPLEKAGADAYMCFTKAVVLEEQMRQSGSASQALFCSMLQRIRTGKMTKEDIDALNERHVENLKDEELTPFCSDAVTLFAEKEPCNEYNSFRLHHLDTPIVTIPATVTSRAPPDFQSTLKLAVGAKVFLTDNIWSENGLYNGSIGTVTEIGPGSPPSVIFVRFPNYSGPRYLLRNDIPLVQTPRMEKDAKKDANFTVHQFPLELCWATTVHKAQGQTLDHVCIGLPSGTRRSSLFYRQSPSLIFVALSRVRNLTDLIITQPFRRELANTANSRAFAEWTAEEARLQQLESDLE